MAGDRSEKFVAELFNNHFPCQGVVIHHPKNDTPVFLPNMNVIQKR